jgi:hypothetical protein
MTEYVKSTRRPKPRRDSEPEAQSEDLRNDELDEDVACCLADIDELLAETESERDRAVREFEDLRAQRNLKGLRVWQAQYAHLGLSFGTSCCGSRIYMYEKDGK